MFVERTKKFIMLKNISNLGRTLSRAELKSITGGRWASVCQFPNGDGWSLIYEHKHQAQASNASCAHQGGNFVLIFNNQ